MANRNPNMAGLRSADKLTKRERSEKGRKGGKASQEVQRQKRLQREILAEILAMRAPVKTAKKLADVLGGADDISNEMAILANVVKQARDKGSLPAAIFIRDTIGEAPTNKVDHTSDGEKMCVAIVPDRQSLDAWSGADGSTGK